MANRVPGVKNPDYQEYPLSFEVKGLDQLEITCNWIETFQEKLKVLFPSEVPADRSTPDNPLPQS